MFGRDRRKSRANTRKLLFFQGNQGQLFQFCFAKLETRILHILDPNYSSFLSKMPQKISQKPIILTFFDTSPNFAPLLLPNFVEHSEFDYTPYVYITEV